MRPPANHRTIQVADLPQRVRHGGLGKHTPERVSLVTTFGHTVSGQFIKAETTHSDYRVVAVTLRVADIDSTHLVPASHYAYIVPTLDSLRKGGVS